MRFVPIKEIRKKALKEDNDIFSYPFRYISTIITMFLVNTRITPLQVTLIHLVIGIIAAVLFAIGEYTLTVIASILFIISYVFDLVDGEIARYKNMKSKLGSWIDHIGDYIIIFFVIVGIALSNFNNTNDVSILILALFALLLIAIIGAINMSKAASEKMKQVKAIKLPIKFKYSKRLHVGIFTISFLILVIGALTQQIKAMFIIYIIIAFIAMIKAFKHRINLIKQEFNE